MFPFDYRQDTEKVFSQNVVYIFLRQQAFPLKPGKLFHPVPLAAPEPMDRPVRAKQQLLCQATGDVPTDDRLELVAIDGRLEPGKIKEDVGPILGQQRRILVVRDCRVSKDEIDFGKMKSWVVNMLRLRMPER
jgi:hypothetical protein